MKSWKEDYSALATDDDLVGCTGKKQSAGDERSKDASSQSDPVLLPLDEGYIHKNQELSAKVVALHKGVDSFHFLYGRHILQQMSGSDNKTNFHTSLPTCAVLKETSVSFPWSSPEREKLQGQNSLHYWVSDLIAAIDLLSNIFSLLLTKEWYSFMKAMYVISDRYLSTNKFCSTQACQCLRLCLCCTSLEKRHMLCSTS